MNRLIATIKEPRSKNAEWHVFKDFESGKYYCQTVFFADDKCEIVEGNTDLREDSKQGVENMLRDFYELSEEKISQILSV